MNGRRWASVVAGVVAAAALTGCSSSGGAAAAYDGARLTARLVSPSAVGLPGPAHVTKAVGKSHTTVVSETFTGPGNLFLFVSLVAAPNGRSAAQAFIEFANTADSFFATGVKRTGLDQGDAGFVLDGRNKQSNAPQLELAFVRGPVEVNVTAAVSSAAPTPLSAADRSLVYRVAKAQDAQLH